MTRILFDASSTDPISGIIAVAEGDCLLLNAYNLQVGQSAQVFRALLDLGEVPAATAGSCFPLPGITAASIIIEDEYLPCGVPVQVAQSVSENITSIVVSQPGFYRVHLTPAALGTAFVEAIVLTGADACERAQAVCCCSPETQWVGTSLNQCLQIIPGGQLGHQPAFNVDPCCLLQQIPAGGPPALTDELIFLRGSTCFVSTVDETFAQMIVCDSLAEFAPGVVAVGDRIIALDVNDNCKALDIQATVTALETDWTGTSNNVNLTITPGGVNGHAPVFDYDLCADLQAFASCACEPSPGDSVPIIQGVNCVLATWPVVDICDQMGLLATGAYVAGDTLLARDSGGSCKQIPIFPLLAPNGSCVAPSYSFTASPNSGMWFDPAVGPAGAVVVSDHNCANRINVGSSIDLISASGAVLLNAATSVIISTASINRLAIDVTGALLLAGIAGVATQVLTSNGPGTPPTWQDKTPILGVSGSCAAPTYSFAASPDSGMFYTGTAVRIGDDNCADFIEVGASINITSSASSVSIAAGNLIDLASAGLLGINIAANGGTLSLSAASNIGIASSGAAIIVTPATTLSLGSGGATRLTLTAAGEWNIIGSGVGALGQVLTSGGAGVPPMWNGSPALTDPTGQTFTVTTNGGYKATGQANGAGVAAGTLTNAPTAGNPNFWLRVEINGVNHFVPAWL